MTMSQQVIHADLVKERRVATFSAERLTNLLDGGPDVTLRRRQIEQRGLLEKVFTEGPPSSFLSRPELYDRAVKKAVHLKKLVREWDLSDQEKRWLNTIAFPLESAPDSLHGGMFLPTLQNLSTEEQKKKWLPLAESYHYIGTYSQTEMGHGTHLRKLETTATYDPTREEFVLHSPTTTSMKWWPGGQGKTTNCAVVMAQLHSQGASHGIQPFFVVFRDLDTHQPLPGITVGDIGPKFGFNTIDNGFLKFDHFRIPRTNMLMKNAEVLRDGTFVSKTKQKKASYTTMTMVRTFIVFGHGYRCLAIGMTIAIRYSAIRRQSELQPGSPEPQILDYQTQQHKLFPYLAMAYAVKFTSDRLFNLFVEAMGEVYSGNDRLMPELHALSSGLKAYTTFMTHEGLEKARMACGGHGYSQASGFPKLYTFSAPSMTFEGENTVLLLQTARYLLKCAELSADQLAPSVAYLARADGRCAVDERLTVESLVGGFEHRARRVVREAAAAVRRAESRGLADYEAKNVSGVFLTRAALAHSEYFVVKSFAEAIPGLEDDDVRRVMTQLCQLLATYHIVRQSGDFLEDGYMSASQLRLVREKEAALLADIRPNAVSLVDAFDFPDVLLGSVLGRYDGQVYENLYHWAQDSPLNDTQVHESYHKYLKPMMQAKM